MRQGVRGAGACVLVLLGVLASGAAPVPSGAPVPFVTLAQGTASGVHERTQLAIHDSESWGRLWTQLAPSGGHRPTVDFGRDMVIAISSGPMPEGTIVTIARIMRVPGRLVVWFTVTQRRPLPEGGDVGTVAPFHIVRLTRSPLPVEFVLVKTPPILHRLQSPGSGDPSADPCCTQSLLVD